MDGLRKRMRAVMSDEPAGTLRKVHGSQYKDELGRAYLARSWQQHENRRQYYERAKNIGKDRRHFVFTDMDAVKEIMDRFSNKHLGYLLSMLCRMEYKTGRLIDEKGASLSENKFKGVLRVKDKRTIDAFIDGMLEHGVFEKREDGYYINQRYHFRNKALSDRLIKSFITALRKVSDEISAGDMGILYRLLPYVHYTTNMICIDPFEEVPENIKYLNVKAIAELIGISERKTKAVLTRLRKAGIISETILRDDQRNRYMILNPYIFYRKPGKPDEALRAMFAATPYA